MKDIWFSKHCQRQRHIQELSTFVKETALKQRQQANNKLTASDDQTNSICRQTIVKMLLSIDEYVLQPYLFSFLVLILIESSSRSVHSAVKVNITGEKVGSFYRGVQILM